MNREEQEQQHEHDRVTSCPPCTRLQEGRKKSASGRHYHLLQQSWVMVAVLMVTCCYSTAEASTFSSRHASTTLASPSFGLRNRSRSRRSFLSSQQPSSGTFHHHHHKRRTIYKEDDDDDDISAVEDVSRKTTTTTESYRLSRSTQKTTTPDSIWYYIKVALAGGIAGAVGSAALYPMDAAKTLRQSCPSDYSSVFHALGTLICTRTSAGALQWHLPRVYRGVIPAALGAIPSSALYFGAYESMKAILTRYFAEDSQQQKNFSNRLLVHALAAMSGNILSSAIFVPKELIKQQLQFRQSGNMLGVMMDILAQKGLGGLYVGYKATLLRNIPTAVLRFSLYEEFRYRWTSSSEKQQGGVSPKFFLAGAAAGVLASGLMTPVDVLKTRLATGTCPVDVRSCFLWVIKEEGFVGLYSGAGSRMIFSGAFSAIGFGTFEWAKSALGVGSAGKSKSVASSSSSSNRQQQQTPTTLALNEPPPLLDANDEKTTTIRTVQLQPSYRLNMTTTTTVQS